MKLARYVNWELALLHYNAIGSSKLKPIPVLLCGKIPSHQEAVTRALEPEFKVVKICSTLEEVRSAVTSLIATSVTITTVDEVEYEKPKVVIMGGRFTVEDFESVHEGVEGAKSVPWIRPGGIIPKSAPSPEMVARVVRKVLDTHIEELKEGKGAGEVWTTEIIKDA